MGAFPADIMNDGIAGKPERSACKLRSHNDSQVKSRTAALLHPLKLRSKQFVTVMKTMRKSERENLRSNW
jgi:hypothetical protein